MFKDGDIKNIDYKLNDVSIRLSGISSLSKMLLYQIRGLTECTLQDTESLASAMHNEITI